jgi:hypothetical protein
MLAWPKSSAARVFSIQRFFYSLQPRAAQELPMRTNLNTVTNGNVFGFVQDRVVTLSADSCHQAAQHLASWHVSKRARGLSRSLKRSGLGSAALAAAPMAMPTCMAITGRQPVRHVSPALVTG